MAPALVGAFPLSKRSKENTLRRIICLAGECVIGSQGSKTRLNPGLGVGRDDWRKRNILGSLMLPSRASHSFHFFSQFLLVMLCLELRQEMVLLGIRFEWRI
jgi:hypothetical protein